MKLISRMSIILMVTLLVIPQVSLAVWWNPFSWRMFSKNNKSNNQFTEIQQLKNRITELELKSSPSSFITTKTTVATTTQIKNAIPTINLVSTSIAATADKANKEADATIIFKITANGNDIYMNDTDTVSGSDRRGVSAVVTNLGEEIFTYTLSSDAIHDTTNHYYTIKKGETKTFTLWVHIVSGGAGFYRVWINHIRWGTIATNENTRAIIDWDNTAHGIDALASNSINLVASNSISSPNASKYNRVPLDPLFKTEWCKSERDASRSGGSTEIENNINNTKNLMQDINKKVFEQCVDSSISNSGIDYSKVSGGVVSSMGALSRTACQQSIDTIQKKGLLDLENLKKSNYDKLEQILQKDYLECLSH